MPDQNEILKAVSLLKSEFDSKIRKFFSLINYFLLLVFIGLLIANQMIIFSVQESLGIKTFSFNKISSLNSLLGLKNSGNNGSDVKLTGDLSKDVVALVISTGAPKVYGEELGLSFDQVQQSMNVMAQYDPTYGKSKIVLEGADLQRYIDIGSKISCEYCCGAASIIDKNGQAACGCAHSGAMRGLAAYLVKNHGQEYSNDEILRELARWKGMYFPKQMIGKMTEQMQNGNFTPDASSLLLGLKLPDYGKGSQEVKPPSEIENLPNMVGGC